MGGGVLLALGLFLAWYHLEVNGKVGNITEPGNLTGWESHPTMRWFLLAGAAAPLILAWIIVNDHALSWPRGEMTAVTAIAAFGLVGYTGVIDRPGDSQSLIGLRYGWFVSLLGTLLMLGGAVMRQQETEVRRKPPGTI